MTLHSPEEVISACLLESGGLFIGISHDIPVIYRQILSILPDLKEQEVSVIFLETFFSSQQPELDIFNSGGEISESLLGRIKEWVKLYPEVAEDVHIALMIKARELGIEIYGIDTLPEANKVISSRNPHWVEVIQERISGESPRFVIVGGELHSENPNKFSPESDGERAVGVDVQLRVPSVTYSVSSAFPKEQIKVRDGQLGLPEGDFVMCVNPEWDYTVSMRLPDLSMH
jgi:hypothetical protein